MSLTLLDWRRQVAALYDAVRRSSHPASAHEEWRAGRDGLLARHPDSPVPAYQRATFTGVPYAPYTPSMRYEVAVRTDVEALAFETRTGTDGVVGYRRVGVVDLAGLGSLDVWWLLGYGGGLFVPVADSGPRTYGGGRYVLDTVKGADLGGGIDLATGRGWLVVDLNFAYNPSCAYDPAWACPLAPPGNRLAREVPAGELLPERDESAPGTSAS